MTFSQKIEKKIKKIKNFFPKEKFEGSGVIGSLRVIKGVIKHKARMNYKKSY